MGLVEERCYNYAVNTKNSNKTKYKYMETQMRKHWTPWWCFEVAFLK